MAAEGGRAAIAVDADAETRRRPDAENGAGALSASPRPRVPASSFEPAPGSVEARLFAEPFAFDFFQAVRILERIDAQRQPLGRHHAPATEAVRVRSHLSLSFPPSQVYELERPTSELPLPLMTVSFMGLYGPSGVLPRHYTELLMRVAREAKGPERHSFRDWLDLFNHRLISLFYRAWEKYRFYIPYERREYDRADPDAFTRALLSLIGLGTGGMRNRLRVSTQLLSDDDLPRERVLGRIDDLALLHYGGFLSQRRPTAINLEALLRDYFQLPVRILQFQGQWLQLDKANQSRMGDRGANNEMGVNLIAGERVWDVQGKVRIRLGPLTYDQFCEFLPDRGPTPKQKLLFVLVHLVRLYVGSEYDLDVQLALLADEVPWCQLPMVGEGGARLGWDTWLRSGPFERDADEAIFAGEEVRFVDPLPAAAESRTDPRRTPEFSGALS